MCMCVLVAHSCPTLCDPMDCRLPGSPVHGILQARILERVDIPFSGGVFPTQGSNPGVKRCRQILYHLRHQGGPYIYMYVHTYVCVYVYAIKLLFWVLSSNAGWGLKIFHFKDFSV